MNWLVRRNMIGGGVDDGWWLWRHTGRSPYGLVEGVLDVKGPLWRLSDRSAQGDVADGGAAPVDWSTPALLLEVPDAEVDHAEDSCEDEEEENDAEELVARFPEERAEPALCCCLTGVHVCVTRGRRRRWCPRGVSMMPGGHFSSSGAPPADEGARTADRGPRSFG